MKTTQICPLQDRRSNVWVIDRRIPIVLVALMNVQVLVFVVWGFSISNRVNELEEKQTQNETSIITINKNSNSNTRLVNETKKVINRVDNKLNKIYNLIKNKETK